MSLTAIFRGLNICEEFDPFENGGQEAIHHPLSSGRGGPPPFRYDIKRHLRSEQNTPKIIGQSLQQLYLLQVEPLNHDENAHFFNGSLFTCYVIFFVGVYYST